jgi:hypothetical protein
MQSGPFFSLSKGSMHAIEHRRFYFTEKNKEMYVYTSILYRGTIGILLTKNNPLTLLVATPYSNASRMCRGHSTPVASMLSEPLLPTWQKSVAQTSGVGLPLSLTHVYPTHCCRVQIPPLFGGAHAVLGWGGEA